jgi:antitoxin component HigA of HigAB toxin-antitoxin module
MNKTLTKTFHAMPKDYAGLCRVFLPRPIHDKVGYENTVDIADVFAGFEQEMTDDQNDYFDLLCDLIEKHDQEIARPSKLRAVDLLKHLLNEHGLSGADLSRLLGKSLPLGPMILRGERKITAEHAIRFGRHFGLRPDLFFS